MSSDRSPTQKPKSFQLSASPSRIVPTTGEEKLQQAFVELDDAIEQYEGKAFKVIHEHEKEFMNAYSGHMNKVYREMETLKKKANENEFQMRRE